MILQKLFLSREKNEFFYHILPAEELGRKIGGF